MEPAHDRDCDLSAASPATQPRFAPDRYRRVCAAWRAESAARVKGGERESATGMNAASPGASQALHAGFFRGPVGWRRGRNLPVVILPGCVESSQPKSNRAIVAAAKEAQAM